MKNHLKFSDNMTTDLPELPKQNRDADTWGNSLQSILGCGLLAASICVVLYCVGQAL